MDDIVDIVIIVRLDVRIRKKNIFKSNIVKKSVW